MPIHSKGERRYNPQCTSRAASGCVAARCNSTTIPPRCALPATTRNAPWGPF